MFTTHGDPRRRRRAVLTTAGIVCGAAIGIAAAAPASAAPRPVRAAAKTVTSANTAGVSATTASTTGPVTADDLRQTGTGQQRWLSVPGSRIAANPNNSTLTGSEVEQNTGAALPLGSTTIADDVSTPQRSLLQTSLADTATPPTAAQPSSTVLAQPLTAAQGWTTTHATATAGTDGTTVTVASDSDWGSIRKVVTVDLDSTPYLTVDVGSVASTWNVKIDLDGDGQRGDEAAVQRPSSNTGVSRFDLAAEYGLHGTVSIGVRLFSEGGAAAATRFDAVGFSGAPAFPDVGSAPAFDTRFETDSLSKWASTSGGGGITSNGGEGTVKIGNAASAGSVARTATINLDTNPMLAVAVPRATGKWALKLHDHELDKDYTIQGDTSARGVFTYDVPQVTGWSGSRTFDIKIYAVGSQYSSTTFDRIAFLPSGTNGWEERARAVDNEWTPEALHASAGYGDSGTLTADDFFHDTDSLVRTIDATGITSGRVVVGGAFTGTATWSADTHTLTVAGAHDTHTFALPDDAVVSFSQANGWEARTGTTATGGDPTSGSVAGTTYWNASLPAGATYSIGIGFAPGAGASGSDAAASARSAASADPSTDIAHWRSYWDGYLAKVPVPSDFGLHGVETAGVTSEDIKSAYYRGWVNLEENMLPATPETGNRLPSLGTDKADNWMKGTPGDANVGSWDSLLGIQDLVYVDPQAAWDTYTGMFALEQSDGNLGGETLPSRKAQTGWILYQVTGDLSALSGSYDALSKQLVWESNNLRWESPTNNIADEVNVSYATSLMVDLQFAEKIATATGHASDVAKWQELRAKLLQEYEQWFFTSDGQTLSLHYLDESHPDKQGDAIAETTGLDVEGLSSTVAGYVQQRFDSTFDTGKQFAGFADHALKAPHEQLTVYGLLARGQVQTAGTLSNAVLRDTVKSGRFAEVYQEASETLDGTPVGTGVWPSLFGIANIIDAVWMNNGYRLDQGDLTSVDLPGTSGSITGLTHLGEPITSDAAQAATASRDSATVRTPVATRTTATTRQRSARDGAER